MEIVEKHTAGCPMNESVKWTYLTQEEIVEAFAHRNIHVSIFVVCMLLNIHHFRKRKMSKNRTIKDVANRDTQFHNINALIKEFVRNGYPIISIDTKKKESLGSLYREGQSYCQTPLEVLDHDFASLRTGLVIPHGIYDITRNEALINLGTSKDTAEFVYDCLLYWWQEHGQRHYPGAKDCLILCDGGGSNNCRHYVFKEAIQKLANTIGIEIRIAHYPTYCSKYNPIEHRVFPYVTKALKAIPLDNIQTVKELIEKRAKTKTGLKVFANVIDKVYQKGRKASEDFLENIPICFDKEIILESGKS